jgi:hypothetical protein
VANAVLECLASVFTDRAIVYRVHNGFGHVDVKGFLGGEGLKSHKKELYPINLRRGQSKGPDGGMNRFARTWLFCGFMIGASST